MIFKYTPFREAIKAGEPVRNLEFADDIIKPYFLMSLRYYENYYKDQPEGNTVYFFNQPECSLLFYFSAGARSCHINGFWITAAERQKAWISMVPLIQSLRSYAFAKGGGCRSLDKAFVENVADLEEVMMDELVPFHFIISSLPDECFPECREIHIFNNYGLKKAERSYHLITNNRMRNVTMAMEDYDILSETSWIPPEKVSKKWHLEYNTGIIEKEGRYKGRCRVLRRETELPDARGYCDYEDLTRDVLKLVGETL